MVNDKDADTVGDAHDERADPAADRPVEARDTRVSRGWLIGAIAAGGVLAFALVFGGGIATGLGIAAVTRGGPVAESGPGQPGHDDGGQRQWGPGAPGQTRPEDGTREERRGPTDELPSPAPSETPST